MIPLRRFVATATAAGARTGTRFRALRSFVPGIFLASLVVGLAAGVSAAESPSKSAKSLSPIRQRPPAARKTAPVFQSSESAAAPSSQRADEAVGSFKLDGRAILGEPGSSAAAKGKTAKRLPVALPRVTVPLAAGRSVKSRMANKSWEHKFDARDDWALGARAQSTEGGGAGGGNACTDCRAGKIDCGGTVEGTLAPGDCLLGDDTLFDVWVLEITEAVQLTLTLDAGFDSFFFFVDADCFVLATNGNCVAGDPFSGSCLTIPVVPGLYHLVANGFAPTDAGPYTLSVECAEILTCSDCLIGEIGCDTPVDGTLAPPPDDCDRGNGTGLQIRSLTLPEPGRLTITMDSLAFDTFLLLYGADCIVRAANDDRGAGDLNSTLVIDLPAGEYFVGASSFAPAAGSYTLEVGCLLGFDFCTDCVAGDLTCEAPVEGELEKSDCTVAATGAFTDLYTFTATESGRFTFTVSSDVFDPAVTFYAEDCTALAAGDTCGVDLTSACVTVDLEVGTYRVGVSVPAGAGLGVYSLSVECRLGFEFCTDCVTAPIDCDSTLSDTLGDGSCTLGGDGSFIDLYPFTLAADGPVIIELSSFEFDTFVWLYDASCNELALDDDGGIDFNSRLVVELTAGDYVIGVNSFATGEIGVYDLSLSCPDVTLCRECAVGAIACGETIAGALDAASCTLDDGASVELYSFTVDVFSVVDVSVTSAAFDTTLFVLDSFCRSIAENDDCTPDTTDSCLDRLILEPGTYSVGVSSFGAGEAGAYSLAVGCEPFDPCVHCVVGALLCGDTVEGELTADDCPLGDGSVIDVWELTIDELASVSVSLESTAFNTFLFLIDGACQLIGANDDCQNGDPGTSCTTAWLQPGTYFVVANSLEAAQSGAYSVRVECLPTAQVCVDCEVSLIDCDTELTTPFPSAPAGCVGPRGAATDFYSFQLAEDELVTIALSGGFDTFLHVFGSDCVEIAFNDDLPGTLNSGLSLDLAAGTYFIGVSSFLIGALGDATLSVECGEVDVDPICTECVVADVACGETLAGTLPQTACQSVRGVAVDAYRIQIAETSAVTFALTPTDPAQAYDTFLHLFDSTCTQIAFDDDGGPGFDSLLSRNLVPGTYFVGVSGFDAGDFGAFTLEVTCGEFDAFCVDCEVSAIRCGETLTEAFPQTACTSRRTTALDTYRFELRRADEVTINLTAEYDTFLHLFDEDCNEIAFNDDFGGGLDSSLTLALGPGTYYIGASSFAAGVAGELTIDLLCSDVPICEECVVGAIGPGETRDGNLPSSGCTDAGGVSIDLWTLDLAEAFAGTIDLESGAIDPTLTLLDANCEQIAFNDDADPGTLNSRLAVDLAAGTYFLQASSLFADETGAYTLRLSGGGVGPFLRGDFDGNGTLQLTDAVGTFNFLFLGGAGPGCRAAADSSGQALVNLTSGVYTLNFLFLGGPPPVAPFPECDRGSLPSDATLGCEVPRTDCG